MGIIELFILAVGLSMDAFAVSICKGLSLKKMSWKKAVIAGLYFGGFQALMPVMGYFLGRMFSGVIESFDHWVAFGLLTIIGINMIRESRPGCDECTNDSFAVKEMVMLAIATSIDALAVGVTLAFLKVNIVAAVSFIGVVTFCFGVAGIKIGNVFGKKYRSKAELAGGIILVAIGLKILIEHMFF